MPSVLERDAFLTALLCETDRAQRMNTPLSLIYFKLMARCDLGDGERAPSELAVHEVVQRVTKILRCYDTVGQMSSDEFVMALPGCTGPNAVTLAERLRAEEIGAPVVVWNEEIRVTGCFGVVASRGRSALVVLEEAKGALRRAQKRGAGAIEMGASVERMYEEEFEIPVLQDERLHW